MLGPTVTERSKRAPVSKGGTEKDQKAAMPRADKSDKIRGDVDDKGEDGLHDERAQGVGVKRP